MHVFLFLFEVYLNMTPHYIKMTNHHGNRLHPCLATAHSAATSLILSHAYSWHLDDTQTADGSERVEMKGKRGERRDIGATRTETSIGKMSKHTHTQNDRRATPVE